MYCLVRIIYNRKSQLDLIAIHKVTSTFNPLQGDGQPIANWQRLVYIVKKNRGWLWHGCGWDGSWRRYVNNDWPTIATSPWNRDIINLDAFMDKIIIKANRH